MVDVKPTLGVSVAVSKICSDTSLWFDIKLVLLLD